MTVKKGAMVRGAADAKAALRAESTDTPASKTAGAPKVKGRPLAEVLDQSIGVQGKVETAGVELSGVNKVLKEEAKTSEPTEAVVEAVEKSRDVEEKVHEAAEELVTVNEALAIESDARHVIEEELNRTQEALQVTREHVKRVRHEALHDDVTGLPNAALFRDRLKSALSQARRHSWRIAVMFIDLDGFKQINDTYGHDVGDALLRLVGERLSGFVRGGDTVSRRSGDEFLFLMLEAKDEENARGMAQRIIDVIGQPVLIGGVELAVSASVGLAMFPDDGTTAKMLLKSADLAMYAAKGRSPRPAMR